MTRPTTTTRAEPSMSPFGVIPHTVDPIEGLLGWLGRRHAANAGRPDVAHEPVVLVAPDLGRIVWDPRNVPRPQHKTTGHRPPAGTVPS